ncbi:hypothetical protein Lser_V15G41059 [Lactuca serriola]
MSIFSTFSPIGIQLAFTISHYLTPLHIVCISAILAKCCYNWEILNPKKTGH